MKRLILMFTFLALYWPVSGHASVLEKELQESVKYLESIPEVQWVKVERNSVIVGWKGLPPQFNIINTEAALTATRAIRRPVFIWSVRHTQKNWIIGTRPYLCKTVAASGMVKETTCNF